MKSSKSNGVGVASVENRIKSFGTNKVKSRAVKTFCEIIMDTLDDFVMKILIFCAFINLLIAVLFGGEHMLLELVDGIAILCAVAICTLVAAFNDW